MILDTVMSARLSQEPLAVAMLSSLYFGAVGQRQSFRQELSKERQAVRLTSNLSSGGLTPGHDLEAFRP